MCIGGTLTQNRFGDFQLSRTLIDLHWWHLNTKSFRWFSAIKKTYSHALMGPKRKIFSAICSDQEYLWMCIGGTLTHNLFGDFQLSRIRMNMHWWNLNTKSFQWFAAIKNTNCYALMGPEHQIFSVIFSYQEYLLTCIGGTLTQNLFGDLQRSRILRDMHWWDFNTISCRRFSAFKNTYFYALVGPQHKIFSSISCYQQYLLTWFVGPEHRNFSAIFSYQEYLLTYIGGALTQNLFGEFQLSRMHIDMHWWDFTTKSFRRFSVIKNTYSHPLMRLKNKIFSAICSAQEYLWMCIGGTLTQNLFGDFQLSRTLVNLHWWHLNTKSFRWFSAIKNTHWHALVWPEHKIVSAIFSYQEYLLTCFGGTCTPNHFSDFQLSRILVDMHWWDLNTKSFRWISAIENPYSHALMGSKQKLFSAICSDQEYLRICIGVTLTRNLPGDFQLSRRLMTIHWWILNTKAFQGFAVIKNTYCYALLAPEHQIFWAIFSFQEYLLTCIGGTLTQNLFGDLQRSRILRDMHWWDFNTISCRRFSAFKNTCFYALVGPQHKIFSSISSYQQYLLTWFVGPEHRNFSAIFSYQEHL